MIKHYCLLLSLILIGMSTADAANKYGPVWNKANAYYQQKKYDSAAILYTKIASQKPSNPEIYYNLGNTYYRLNDIGHAVLNYEKALKYNPSYTKASDNLYLTQSRIENRITPVRQIFFLQWWNTISAPNISNLYAIIAVLIFLTVIIYYSLRTLSKINYTIPIKAIVGVCVLGVLLLLISFAGADRVTSDQQAVIVHNNTLLFEKPGSSTNNIVPIGTKVKIESTKGDYKEVTLPDGRNGWLPVAALEKI